LSSQKAALSRLALPTSSLTATSNGKALLAWLPENRVNEIMRVEGLSALTRKAITDPAAFWVDFAATRERVMLKIAKSSSKEFAEYPRPHSE